jgi:lysozyme family protein
MFDQALTLILAFEGGFANDPDDPGGRTNFGITQNVYDPTLKKDVKNITPDEVHRIYENNYWREGHCDAINTVNPNLATIHFDNCVNCGVGGAARMLQDVLGVQVDGIIGKQTLAAITSEPKLITKYLERRKSYYDRIIANRPKSKKFRSSWYHRLNVLATRSGSSWRCYASSE